MIDRTSENSKKQGSAPIDKLIVNIRNSPDHTYLAQDIFQAQFKKAKQSMDKIIAHDEDSVAKLKEYNEHFPEGATEKRDIMIATVIIQERIERNRTNLDTLNFEYLLFGIVLDEIAYIKQIIQKSNNVNKTQKDQLDELKNKYEPILQGIKNHLDSRLEQAKKSEVDLSGMYV